MRPIELSPWIRIIGHPRHTVFPRMARPDSLDRLDELWVRSRSAPPQVLSNAAKRTFGFPLDRPTAPAWVRYRLRRPRRAEANRRGVVSRAQSQNVLGIRRIEYQFSEVGGRASFKKRMAGYHRACVNK